MSGTPIMPYQKIANGTLQEFRFASTGRVIDLDEYVPYTDAQLTNIPDIKPTDTLNTAVKILDGKIRALDRDKAEDGDLSAVAKSGDYDDLTNKPYIPVKVSDLTNDTGYITGVSWDDVSDKPASFTPADHPHKTSDINSLSGYVKAASAAEITAADSLNVALGKIQKTLDAKQNSADVISEADKATKDGSGNVITTTYATKDEVSAIPKFKIQVVNSLPATGDAATVYLVKTGDESGNLYTEYIYVNNKWEELGTQALDLSGYALKSELPVDVSELNNDAGYLTSSDKISSATNADNATKATKDSSGQTITETYVKGLSVSGRTITITKGDDTTSTIQTQDTTYGAATSNKLGLVMIGANITNTNGILSLTQSNVTSALGYTPPTQDTTYGLATQTESGLMSNTDKVRLDNIEDNANNYVHPTSGATAGSYGPTANVTGTNNTTINVPQITIDANGHVTGVTNRVYTSKDTTYSAMTAAEATTGTATTGRLITAKVLHDKIGEVADAKIADIDTGVMSVTTGETNGTLSVDGTDVAVKGLASGAYADAYTHPASGVTADTYGPTANVTGTNNTTLTVPEITVDAQGHITGVTERTYTSKDTTYGAGTTSLLNTGTDTANRVWPAKQIADYVTGKIGAVDTGVMSVTTGTTNGTISVDGTDVDVKGLGSAAYTASTAYAPASHTQASNTIDAMTDYSKPSATSAIATTDTLNAAIGKLEKALDGKQASLSAMTAAEATTGTATTARSITAKVLHDKIKAVADASAAAIDTGVMSVTTGSANGTLSVDGTDVAVKGLASGAYADAYVHPTTAGNKHIPSGGSSGQILKYSSSGTAVWANEYSYTHPTTAGNKHIPTGGATGNVLKYGGSSGTASWGTLTASDVGALASDGTAVRATADASGNNIATTYATKDEVSTIPKFKIEVVTSLPTTGESATIYLVNTGDESGNLYTEYIYVNNAWEKLGTQTLDLSGYALKSDITTGSTNGTIAVDGTDVAVKGLASGAYAAAYVHPTTAGNKHIPSGGASGQILKYSSSGTAVWANEYSYTHPASGVTADTYGPTANVTGTNNTTLIVPEITVDANGHITGVTERTYTSKDTTYSAMTAAEATTGTATTARSITAKVLHDKIGEVADAKIAAIDTGVMSVTTGSANGTLSVDGTDVAVKGLGSAAYTASTAYAPASHNQASNTIDAMTGYSKPSATSAIATTDTLNAAIGKLEKALDGKQASLSAMTASEATTGTATTARSITAKVLHDKIKEVADASAAAIDTGVMSVTTGSTNGTLSVDGTDVAVKGLASGAYAAAYSHPTTAGNKHIPSGGSTGQILRWSAAGTAAWGAENNTTYTGSNGITLTGTNFTNSGVRSIATGTANGTISVNTNGTAADVAVKGLASGAYADAYEHPNSGATAGSYGPSANASPAHGAGFSVPYVTINAQGHVTAASTKTITLPAQYTHPTGAGNNHIPSGGSSGQFLKWSSSGVAVWAADNNTLNTAGSTDTSSKIFLIGATSQAANPQTYSDNEVYVTSGVLTTKSVQIGGTACTLEYNDTNKCVDFVFA